MIIDRSTACLVVDSTADLPEKLVADPNLTLVPLTVFFGTESYLDWVELSPPDFYRKLAAFPELPTTSQLAPGVWSDTYRRLRERYSRRIHLRPTSIVGSVIGTYIGPGAVGLGFIQE